MQLRARAEREGWSVRALARCAGLSHSTVSRLWRGRIRSTPRILAALGRCLGSSQDGASRSRAGPSSDADPAVCKAGRWAPLPADVTEQELLTALDGLTAMAGGPEVPGMIRVGFEDKRARLESLGLTGSMLSRLDRLYRLYMEGGSESVPPSIRARIGACLLYFILSADRVPDDVLPIGYLDDAWVVDRVWHEARAAQGARFGLDVGCGSGRGFVPPGQTSGA